nr:hypothetical protein [uncultured Campylobacter sp.]
MKFIAYYDSPLGKITLAGDGAGLCGLWFEGEKYYAHALTASGADGKFCMRDIAAKTDAAAREGYYEKSCTLETKSGADKKHIASDLLAKKTVRRERNAARYCGVEKKGKERYRGKSGERRGQQILRAHTYRERKILHARYCS